MFSLAIFVIHLILLVLFSRLLDRFLAELFPKGHYRWVIWPGIVVHELSHAIVGKLMGAKITDVSLFAKTGGSVTHTKPKIPLIGVPFTSMAPLLGCTLAIIVLTYAFDFDQRLIVSNFDILTLLTNIGLLFRENVANWLFWLFLYLVLAITTAIAPSNQDFKNSWWGIGFILFGFGALLYFDIGTDFLTGLLKAVSSFFALGIIFELMINILVVPFWFLKRRKYTFE